MSTVTRNWLLARTGRMTPTSYGWDGRGLRRGFSAWNSSTGWRLVLPWMRHVGHAVQPLAGGGVDQGEVAQFQAGQEVLFDVPDGVLHAALFMGLADAAGGDGKAEVVGEVLVARVEDRGLADGMLQHGASEGCPP